MTEFINRRNLIGVIVIGLIAMFVWPTPYIVRHDGGDFYRVNRFTGVTELSTSDGWKTETRIDEEQNELDRKLTAKVVTASEFIKDEGRSDLTKIFVNNPTQYTLSSSASDNVKVDWYQYHVVDASKTLPRTGKTHGSLNANSNNEIRLEYYDDMRLLRLMKSLPPATRLRQIVTIEFDRVIDTQDRNSNKDQRSLTEPVRLVFERDAVTKY